MTVLEHRHFLIGLPAAGKTTFIAAAFHVAETGEVPDSLRLHHVEGEMKHLNRIRECWVNAEPVGRTVSSETVTLLFEAQNGEVISLHLPDISGESFREQWSKRKMSAELAGFLRNVTGGLLLVHPAHIKEETLIRDVQPLIREVASVLPEARDLAPGHEAQKDDLRPYKADDAPTQLKLVELLQFALSQSSLRPLPLSLIISAYDMILLQDADMSPDAWARGRLPLLWQFLKANPELFDVEYYGVSAQGGPLEDAVSLRKHARASERIIVVPSQAQRCRDITLPIRALLE